MKKQDDRKLELWKRRLRDGESAFADERKKMDKRERLYQGEREITPLVPGDTQEDLTAHSAPHVRNLIFENIESQVSSAIPMPKVTARRKKDEPLAELIEHFLRNELDRLPFEQMNDMAERTVPLQGGCAWLVEWDNSKQGHSTVGEVGVRLLHPKQLVPQPGIYTGMEDMDWFILKMPSTREAVRRRYGVDLEDERETEPDVRGQDGADHGEDAVTLYIGYAVGDSGGIDRFSWVGDTVVEDLEDYQARRQPVCRKCGRVRPLPGQTVAREETESQYGFTVLNPLTGDGTPIQHLPAEPERRETYANGPCPWCGAEDWTDRRTDYEEILLPLETRHGVQVPGLHPELEDGRVVMQPTRLPFYQPRRFPIILQRSVSVFGQLLGSSDADVTADQQRTANRMEKKIIDRLVKAGTRITVPPDTRLRIDPRDSERWILENPADKGLIGVYEFTGDITGAMAYLSQVYEESRQLLGITDSFQGRRDATATSGKAKEFAAAQSAGRLESKRVMKQAAYAAMFEAMFQFWLAYSDEPRPVSWRNSKGETEYGEFDRYDFLEQDPDGSYWWNDLFLFSCDSTETLASNREALWQETRLNLQTGAFGDPQSLETLILFWTKMMELHYPGAADTRSYLKEMLTRQQEMMAQQAAMQQVMAANAAQPTPPEPGQGLQVPEGMAI